MGQETVNEKTIFVANAIELKEKADGVVFGVGG